MKELIEKLAAIEHQRWSDWQKYLHSKCLENTDGSLTIINTDVLHWNRQIGTHYDHLSECEKESDREQVRRYLPLVEEYNRSTALKILEWIKKKSLREHGLRVPDIEEFITKTFLS